MLNYVVFDNQIKVWWDYIKLQKDKVYSVFLDGKKLDEIKETNFSFKNYEAEDGDSGRKVVELRIEN